MGWVGWVGLGWVGLSGLGWVKWVGLCLGVEWVSFGFTFHPTSIPKISGTTLLKHSLVPRVPSTWLQVLLGVDIQGVERV